MVYEPEKSIGAKGMWTLWRLTPMASPHIVTSVSGENPTVVTQ